jgi:hypothetical protein
MRGLLEFHVEHTEKVEKRVFGLLRSVAHPPWLCADEGNGMTSLIRFHPEKWRNADVDREISIMTFMELRRCAVLLSREQRGQKQSTRGLLADALRLYIQGMDAIVDHERLVAFWQMAECLTLAERQKGSGDIVTRRLAWLSRRIGLAEPSHLKDVLWLIFRKRNDIVHRGIHGDVRPVEVVVLKAICEHVLQTIWNVAEELPTVEHLEKLYLMKKEDIDVLEQALGVFKNLDSM